MSDPQNPPEPEAPEIYYSPARAAFFPGALRAAYEAAGTWPEDARGATEEEWLLYGQAAPPEGLVRGTAEGAPAWVEPPAEPPPTLEEQRARRAAAYRLESDPLKMEADYDALLAETAPDYTAWLAAVAAIKARFPLPGA